MPHPPPYRPFGAFRLALAMLVLLQHGLLLLGPVAREAFYDLELGSVAVTTFFALSGFIVAEALQRFYAGRPGAFLGNRVLRVVPAYLVALGVAVVVDGWLHGRGWLVPLDGGLRGSPLSGRVVLAGVLEIVPGLPAGRISGEDFSFIPFAWTLRIEFAFYLAAALAGWVVARVGPGWAWRATWVGLAAAYGVFAAFILLGGRGPLQVICIPFFGFGVLVLLGERSGRTRRLHLVPALGCVLLAFTYFRQHGHPLVAFQLVLVALLYGALLALSHVEVSTGLRRWDRRAGELSYPLYISHGIVLTLLTSLSAQRGATPYAVAILASLALAAALHLAVEQPLRAVRTRLRGAVV